MQPGRSSAPKRGAGVCRGSRNGLCCPLHLACVHTPAHSTPAHTHLKKCSCSQVLQGHGSLRSGHSSSLPEVYLSSGLELAQGGWKDSSGPHLSPVLTLSSSRIVMLSLEFDYMCQYDYVEVRDGDSSDSQIIKRFCGNERPAPIRSTGSSLHILFHSDGSKNFDGFHAIFEEITGKGQREKGQILFYFGIYFLAMPHGMWDLSSPTRD